VSALDCTKALVGTGRILFCINGFRNKMSHLVGPPLTPFKTIISLAFPSNMVDIGRVTCLNIYTKKAWNPSVVYIGESLSEPHIVVISQYDVHSLVSGG